MFCSPALVANASKRNVGVTADSKGAFIPCLPNCDINLFLNHITPSLLTCHLLFFFVRSVGGPCHGQAERVIMLSIGKDN